MKKRNVTETLQNNSVANRMATAMNDADQKTALLAAAAALLKEADRPEKITSRQIASRAGVNAAMINYYYGSKEELVAQGVGKILEEAGDVFTVPPSSADRPKERLRRILRQICGVVVKYRRYTRIYVPHLLLEDEINLPQYLLPEIRAHFDAQKSETDCRIIAYQMVSFLQLAFYRAEAFMRYAGIDLSVESACDRLIDWELGVFLPDREE